VKFLENECHLTDFIALKSILTVVMPIFSTSCFVVLSAQKTVPII
jgi:hypothetical protein